MTHPMSSTTPKFFGLTALGAPDPWHNKLHDTVMIDIFTEEDVRSSFARTELPSGGVVIEEFLEDLYHGEYPGHELDRLNQFFEEKGGDARSGPVFLDLLVEAIDSLRNVSANQISESVYTAGDGSEFTSNKLMREQRFKHSRLKRDPDTKYCEPVTTSMAVGWTAPPELTEVLKPEHHPKKSCAETKYQDALVKTGMTYR
eukprot:CAMPEP_0114346798 /NCGR_PEP_ID=MMETSP0101-20121206/13361_1 /TAXON_ID=38822 ORGANISM="Pteridomonas danica, Strain PT" /NCGR_SAMPLE_ID=MMETSP0101 /ASSEMBLY_ACC=CAM_ASM_000211 /LENGTH=200 /DNA_ID=CAMNT_0001483669 /DNA_START=77 /DNA_END=679 /DNA_ORIENTATION=+